MRRMRVLAAVPLLALSLAACQQEADDTGAEGAQAGAAATTGLQQLPVSINETMVGLIDRSADYLWAVGNGDLPQNEADWDLVRSAAYDMILGGQIIKVPGTGELDQRWVREENWQRWSDDLTAIGREALPLAENRSTDREAWLALGDRLVQNCEGCHDAFKPELPTEGVLHRSTAPESRGESIFD